MRKNDTTVISPHPFWTTEGEKMMPRSVRENHHEKIKLMEWVASLGWLEGEIGRRLFFSGKFVRRGQWNK